MEDERRSEQPVVVWERPSPAVGEQEAKREPARVVPLRPARSEPAGEPFVVTRQLPGRTGDGAAGTITYVGSGFWANAKSGAGSDAAPCVRMAA
jgi:hypothetical protein